MAQKLAERILRDMHRRTLRARAPVRVVTLEVDNDNEPPSPPECAPPEG